MGTIWGIHKEQPDVANIHLRATQRAAERYLQTRCRADILKAVNHGVRVIVAQKKKNIDPALIFCFCEVVNGFMKLMTPRELMQVFPIEKSYDGKKSGMKDYFSTMEALKDFDIDSPISENIDDLLWYYWNPTLITYQKVKMIAASDLGVPD